MNEARIEFLLRAGPPADARYEPVLVPRPGLIAFPTQVVRGGRPERLGRRLSLAQASVVTVLVLVTVGVGLLAQPRSGETPPGGSPSAVPSAPASPSPLFGRFPGGELQATTEAWAAAVGAGVATAVALDGRIFLAGEAIHPDIGVVRLGAISRLYLVGVTLGLVDENRVSLDDPVSRFVPDWPRADEITVRMLVSGSSGIAAFGEPLPDLQARIAADPSRDWSASDALTIARSREPRFDPGSRVSPTDTDDALLAEIIASVTGDTASAEIRRRLLEPLGLDATFAAGEPVPPAGSSSSPGAPRAYPEMIRGHAVGASPGTFEQVDDLSAELLSVLGPARGMAATVGDVARWSDLLRRDRAVLSPESRGLVSLPYESGGVGGAATCPCLDGAPRAVVIEGRSGAYSALVAWFPDGGVTIAILVDREVARADIQALLEQVNRLVPK